MFLLMFLLMFHSCASAKKKYEVLPHLKIFPVIELRPEILFEGQMQEEYLSGGKEML